MSHNNRAPELPTSEAVRGFLICSCRPGAGSADAVSEAEGVGGGPAGPALFGGASGLRSGLVGKILHLRQNDHFGPEKISMYLKRYHDVDSSKSGVWRILKRLNMSRLPESQRYQRHDRRWKRYEKQRPGHHVQPGASEHDRPREGAPPCLAPDAGSCDHDWMLGRSYRRSRTAPTPVSVSARS